MRTTEVCAWLLNCSLLFAVVLGHVTITPSSVKPAFSDKIILKVPHGCDGSPTRSLTVTVPVPSSGASPAGKAGWDMSIKLRPLLPPVTSHGATRNTTLDAVT